MNMAGEEKGNVKLRVEIRSGWGIGGLYPFVVACFDNNLKQELHKTRAVVGGQLAVWDETFTVNLQTKGESDTQFQTVSQNKDARFRRESVGNGVYDHGNSSGRESKDMRRRKPKGRGRGREKPMYLTFFVYDTGRKGIPSLGSAGVLLKTVHKCSMATGNFPIVHGLGSLYVSVAMVGDQGCVARRRSCGFHGGTAAGAGDVERSPSVDNIPSLIMRAVRGADSFDKMNDEAATREPSVSELSPDDDENNDDHQVDNGNGSFVNGAGGGGIERDAGHGQDIDTSRELGVQNNKDNNKNSDDNNDHGNNNNDDDDDDDDAAAAAADDDDDDDDDDDGNGEDEDNNEGNDDESPTHLVHTGPPTTHTSFNRNLDFNLNLNRLLQHLRAGQNNDNHHDSLHHDFEKRCSQTTTNMSIIAHGDDEMTRNALSGRSISPQYDDDGTAAFFERLRRFPNFRDEETFFNLSQSLPHSEHEYFPSDNDHDHDHDHDFDNLMLDADELLRQYYDF